MPTGQCGRRDRLQERITGPNRATVTALTALATDALTIGIYPALSPAGGAVAFAASELFHLLFTAPALREGVAACH